MSSQEKMKKSKLVTITSPRAGATEEFRILRTNLQFMGVEKKIHRIVITSTQPGEGKTTVSANLGVVMAQAGSKVLIIDCDLRRPALHPYFNEKLTPGVTNYFTTQDEPASKNIKKTEVEGLDIITSGAVPPNPSELLASSRMRMFLDEVSKGYDYVIVDSPPSGAFADAAMLSKLCDGVLYVCSSGDAKKDFIKKSVESFNKIDSKVLGVVVNKVSKKTMRYNYGYYSYYQSYYHNDGADQQ
jgi:capsular exopolysaccharide synthesis family protein